MTEQWIAHYSAHLDAAMLLASQGLHEAAIQKYDAAIEVNPSISVGYINRGLAFFELKRLADALQDLNRAIELQPTLAMSYNNRGAILRSMGRQEAAAQDYVRAIELAGDAAVDAYGNLATYYFEAKQYQQAVLYYEKAITLQPDYGLTHWNFGMCLLLLGDLTRGWREYHWRWRVPTYQARFRNFDVPLWLGNEPLADKTILLQAEQGFGDMIQFCRYATLVAAQGARVLLEVQTGLVELCKSVAGVHQVFAMNDALPGFDFYCPMMSLPLAFNTTLQNIPAPVQYLVSDLAKVQRWQIKLGAKTKPRIGIVWSSDPTLAVGASKTIPLEMFADVLSDEFEFISLQQNLWYQEQPMLTSLGVHHFGDELGDFSDTAALCGCMDLIISVDTSVAHLAGAMGKPVCILLHNNPDWRWLLDRSDSVWYPTAKIYRQGEGQNWRAILSALRMDLNQMPVLHKN